MGVKAEELGIEIYPGFAASEVLLRLSCYCLVYCWIFVFIGYLFGQILYDSNDNVIGIGTNDMGISKDGSKKENFQRGVELKGSYLYLSLSLICENMHILMCALKHACDNIHIV